MNKRMRELLSKIDEKTAMAKAFLNSEDENKDVDKAAALMDEIDELRKEYETEKRLFEAGKLAEGENANAQVVDPIETPKNEEGELGAIKKFGRDAKEGFMLSRKDMNETTLSDGGYAVPEDIVTQIQTYRNAKASLLDLVTVVPVKTNKGQRTFKKRAQQTGFTKVGEGGKIGKKETPKFERLPYEIDKYAGYFAVTDEVLEDSDANVAQVLIEWIGDESRVTANKLIMNEIKSKKAENLENMDGIKKAINVTLGQAFAGGITIVTNDDGLQYLDTLKDSMGRYLLAPMPGDTVAMSLQVGAQRIPLKIIPNADLPTDKEKIPFIIGDLKEGIVYWDRKKMNIKISDIAVIGELNAFEEDLTLYRAIEREDVTVRDADAFINGYIVPTAEPEPVTPPSGE
ncbi:phage major capsid protein [Anaerovoracaceae bacterium 41-7]|uniref:phage major capsid protein n=1 Tax=Emergencia sp. JLR.KK010 TaxID=3114296 RepID=UPI0030CD3F03